MADSNNGAVQAALTFEEYVEILRSGADSEDNVRILHGEVANKIRTIYGAKTLKRAASEAGIKASTLYERRQVVTRLNEYYAPAESIEPGVSTARAFTEIYPAMRWTHLRLIARQKTKEDADNLLDIIADMSPNEAERHVAKSSGPRKEYHIGTKAGWETIIRRVS